MSPHLRNLYTKSLQAPSIAHVDAFLILSAQKASQLPREHFQQYLLEVFTELQAKKKSLIRICSEWDDWIEWVQSGREQNNYLPKAGTHYAYSKVLKGFKEINSNTGFFLP